MAKITYKTYLDKVWGGWFGKCLGGAAGAPVEGVKRPVIQDMRAIFDKTVPNDDLDLQLLWLCVLEDKGDALTPDDLAQAWLERCWYPFGEYGVFLKNYMCGIRPPYTGGFNNDYFKEGMGCPIRSEIWGMAFPGRPEKAAEYARMDGSLDHVGPSIEAEQFLASLQSEAFFNDDLADLVESGLARAPEGVFKSGVAAIFAYYKEDRSFDEVRRLIYAHYTHPDFTNYRQNLAITVAALLYGGLDMESSLNMALSCGYDTDCTCATVGATIGIIKGYEAMPEDLKDMLCDQYVIGIDVTRPDTSVRTLALDTCRVGLSLPDSPVTDVPAEITPLVFPEKRGGPALTVEYEDLPSIGFDTPCTVTVRLHNPGDAPLAGRLTIRHPAHLRAQPAYGDIEAPAGGEGTLTVTLSVAETDVLPQVNRCTAEFAGQGAALACDFGMMGAVRYRITGPFTDPYPSDSAEHLPPCHAADSTLPNDDAMFSNYVDPDKEYIDEAAYVADYATAPADAWLDAPGHMVPAGERFGLYGEAVFYLASELVFEEDVTHWVVLGNNDAYTLWINGEAVLADARCRVWQPQCRGALVNFRKGRNTVLLKLCRRTETLTFSLGIRRYEGNHYHRMKWEVDYGSARMQ